MDGWVQNYARWAGWTFFVSLFGSGLAVALADGGNGRTRLELVFALLAPTVLWFWCALDARKRGKVFVHGFATTSFMTWPVLALAYLVWTRGRRGVRDYLILAFASVVVGMLGAGLGLAIRAQFD